MNDMFLRRRTRLDRIRSHRITRLLGELWAGVVAGSEIAHGERPAATSPARRWRRTDA